MKVFRRQNMFPTNTWRIVWQLFVGLYVSGSVMTTEIDSPASYTAKVTINLSRSGRPLSGFTLGSNIQWAYNGDGLLQADSLEYSPAMLGLTSVLQPSVIRYPGGGLSDFYRWRDGLGPLEQRKSNPRLDGTYERVAFGTDEFLEFCKRTGAAPMLTFNVITGTASEAADWLTYVNSTMVASGADPSAFPSRLCEIGNEPYLISSTCPSLSIAPEEFASRANMFIRAIRAVDPTALIGIPFRSDTIGTGAIRATDYPNFNQRLLDNLTEEFDFAAVHNAYFPIMTEWQTSDRDLYLATAAATRVIETDLAATRSILKNRFPGRQIKIAVTEFNALYSIGLPETDCYIATLGAAVYLADCFRVFAQANDIMTANFWSLAHNWYFGSIDYATTPRPAYYVLKSAGDMLRGPDTKLMTARVECPVFSNPQVGLVPAYNDLPTLETFVTRTPREVRIMLINKDIAQAANTQLRLTGAKSLSATIGILTGDRPFGKNPDSFTWLESHMTSSEPLFSVMVPAHSIAFLTVRYRPVTSTHPIASARVASNN